MRSRYAAYAVGAVDYILLSTHPDGPHHRADTAVWRSEVEAFCSDTTFEGLQVHGAGFEAPGLGWVEFTATLQRGDEDVSFRERSRFRPHNGRWRYLDGRAILIP